MNRPGVRQSLGRIWRWPSLLAGLITFGLLSALLGQGGVWWPLSWVALAIPLGLIVRYSLSSWTSEQGER
jgi:hypothetical protein